MNRSAARLTDATPADAVLRGDKRSDAGESYLATDHLLVGLKGRAISSGVATGMGQIALFGLNLGSIVVLARLLTPGDFGLIGMVAAIAGFLRVFNEAGLSTATVQKEQLTLAQVSNLFWANLALGAGATLLLAAISPLVAWFYHDPRLAKICLALSLTFLLASSTVQHLALLRRQMRFKIVAIIQVTATAISVATGIAMAWAGYRYWSLVAMQLALPMVTVLMAWSATRWYPGRPSRRSGTRSMLSFGANLTVSSFLWSLARGADNLLIGKFFGSEALGLYTRASALLNRPLEQAMAPIEAVFVPVFSRLQSQPERYRRIAFQLYDTVAVATLPLAGMLLPLARPLTLGVLGAKWVGAADIFAAFTLSAFYVPMIGVAGWMLISQGRGRDFVHLSCFNSVVTVAAFLVGLRFGPTGVAASFSLSCVFLQLPVTYWITGRQGAVRASELGRRLILHLPLWAIVCAATFFFRGLFSSLAPLAQVVVCGCASALVGLCAASIYTPSRRALMGVLDIWKEWSSKTPQ